MAKYNRLDEPGRIAKEFIEIGATKEKALNNKLKELDRARNCRKLFNEGYAWYKQNELDEANEIIEFEGKELPKKDIIHFKRGYQEAVKEEGYNYGFNGTLLDDVPPKFINDKFFLDGYKRGIQDLSRKNRTK